MFDALHKWLAIPPAEQPPNEYRLLGIALFEEDAEVIDAAADKHLAFLHGLANGEHGVEAEELSNRISAARLRLLNKKKKAAYDQQLRQQMSKPQGIAPSATAPLGTAPTGTAPLGTAPIGQVPSGTAPSGTAPIGTAPSGTAPSGTAPLGQVPSGTAPTGQIPSGQVPIGTAPSAAGLDTSAASADVSPATSPAPSKRARLAGQLKLPSSKSPSVARRRSSTWQYTILPGAAVLAMLIVLLAMGAIQLDRRKMIAIGIPDEIADSVAAPSPDAASKNQVTNNANPSASGTNDAANNPSATPSATGRPSRVGSSTSTGSSIGASIDGAEKRDADGDLIVTPSPGMAHSVNSAATVSSNPATPTRGQPGSQFTPPPVRSDPLSSLLNQPTKPALPSADQVDTRMTLVRNLYQEEYRQAKTKSEKVALAEKMLTVVDETENDPAGKFALLRVARDIFIGQQEYQKALHTVDRMDEDFDAVETVKLKAEPLVKIKTVPPSKIVDYADAVINVAHESFQSGRVDIGRALVDAIQSKVPQRIPANRVRELQRLADELNNAAALLADYEKNCAILENDPTNADACTAVGRYLCAVEDRWQDGLPYLRKGSDKKLHQAATLDRDDLRLDQVLTPAEQRSVSLVAESWHTAANAASV